jgi:hypothetical protein
LRLIRGTSFSPFLATLASTTAGSRSAAARPQAIVYGSNSDGGIEALLLGIRHPAKV